MGRVRDSRNGKGAKGRPAGLPVWIVGLAMLAAVIAGAAARPGFVNHLGNLVFDGWQRAKPRQAAGAPVTVVDIDEGSIAALGQWPWPRTTLATMVERLGTLGAAAIAFDMVFPEADRTSPSNAIAALARAGVQVTVPSDARLDNDAALAEAFAGNPVIAGIAISNETETSLPPPRTGFAFGGADPATYLPAFRGGVANLPVLDAAAPGLGFFSFPLGGDGVVRALPLVAAAQGRLYPALSLEALRIAQGAGSIVVRSTGASGETAAGAAAMTALKVGALTLPTGPQGQFHIYYSGLPDMATIPAARLLDAQAAETLRPAIEGHIVLVGTSAVGLRDLVATPFQQAMAGVRVHAEIIGQMLEGEFLTRPDWAPGAELALAALLGLAVLAVIARGGALTSSLAALTLAALAAILSWAAFGQARLLLNPVAPVGAVLGVFCATMPVRLLLTDREKRFIRDAFGRYLSPALVGRLADNPQALRLGGETRELTVLFCDIRGFTTLSETLDPDALTKLLNDFLTPATDVLLKAEATIDKYIGDAIMAFWNAPLDIAGHPRRACLAALDMLEAVATLNRRTGRTLGVGIGLHSGPCCVGNLGSAQRFSYSAIGDSVNVAARVEGLTRQYGVPILVTEATRRAAGDLAFLEADLVRVIGRAEPIRLHLLAGSADRARSPAFRELADLHGRFLDLYRKGEVAAADRALTKAREAAGAADPAGPDGLYRLYTQRLEAMRQTPPDPHWDGVHNAERK